MMKPVNWAKQPRRMLYKTIEGAQILPPWKASELAAFLKRTRMTHTDLAERLQVTPRTVSRWVNGETAIPRVVELACAFLEGR